MEYGGAFGVVFIKHVLASTIKKGVSTSESQDRHHRAQVECARQRYDLDRFSIVPVSCCQWETGFQDRRRTIKRGSQVSNLIASLWRAHIFAYLAYHLSWFLFGFSPCWVLVLVVIFMTSPSSSKTDFLWKTCCVFVLEILPVHLRVRVHTFPCVVSPLYL